MKRLRLVLYLLACLPISTQAYAQASCLNAFGVEVCSQGPSSISMGPGGTVTVTGDDPALAYGALLNLGATGSIEIVETDDLTPGIDPEGTFSEWTTMGPMGGMPDQELMVVRNEVVGFVVETSVNFSGLGATQVRAQFFEDDVLIEESTVSNGTPSYASNVICGFSYMGT